MASVQIHMFYKSKKSIMDFCKFIEKEYGNAELILTNILILLQMLLNIGYDFSWLKKVSVPFCAS